jgi:hypothetical protein
LFLRAFQANEAKKSTYAQNVALPGEKSGGAEPDLAGHAACEFLFMS